MSDENTAYNDRALTVPDDAALPKPQIEIIVDGNSVFKPGMRTFFVDEYDEGENVFNGRVMGQYCSCDAVVSTHIVCTCDDVCTCDAVCTCETVCSCVDYSSCSCVGNIGSTTICTCQSVSCGSPCACVPVH